MKDIKNVLKKYDLAKYSIKRMPEFLLIKTKNEVYRVDSESGCYVLKKISLAKQNSAKKEVFFTQFFIKKGFLPSGYIIKTSHQKIGVKSKKCYFILFKYIGKCSLFDKIRKNKIRSTDITSIAESISRMHKELSGLAYDLHDDGFKLRLLHTSSEFLNKDKKGLVRKLFNKCKYLDDCHIPKEDLIHGDMSVFHIISYNKRFCFIDLGNIRLGNKIEDLVAVATGLCIVNSRLDYNRLKRFLLSYRGVIRRDELLFFLYHLKLYLHESCLLKPVKMLSNFELKKVHTNMINITEDEFLNKLSSVINSQAKQKVLL